MKDVDVFIRVLTTRPLVYPCKLVFIFNLKGSYKIEEKERETEKKGEIFHPLAHLLNEYNS